MKKYLFTLGLLFSVSFAAIGQSGQSDQSVVLCESYDEFGTASGIYGSWNIDLAGGYVYIIYKQIYAINASSMYLQMDKKSDYSEEYINQKTITLTPESGKNWLMYDYFFSEAGKYKITIMMDGKVAATTTTEIFVVDSDDYDYTDADSSINTFYYEDSEVSFCTSISEGNMIGESESFQLGSGGSVDVVIYITNDYRPFKTDLFYIDVYLGDEEVDSFNIQVEEDWDYAHVKQTFTKPGTYMIDVYNADDIFINTGEVTIY